MAVEVDGKAFEANSPSKRTAKLHVAVKVSTKTALKQYLQTYTLEVSVCSLQQGSVEENLGWNGVMVFKSPERIPPEIDI